MLVSALFPENLTLSDGLVTRREQKADEINHDFHAWHNLRGFLDINPWISIAVLQKQIETQTVLVHLPMTRVMKVA